jgi:hypothetical protein
MTLLWRIVLARIAQAGVTVEPNNTWQSSEPGLHLAWKIEVRNPLRELTQLEDRL